MNVREFVARQFVPAPRREVFAFFERPENLARITPARMGFRILTPSPLRMKEGALIDYTVRVAGIPVRWRTLITAYDPPRSFTDEQLKGPYSFWHHTHTFEEDQGGTRMTDRVLYALPMSPLSAPFHPMVRRELDAIFSHRARVLEGVFPDSRGEETGRGG
ncbi:MAG: SRPBCC family protein [Bacteroidota bacterium]